MINARPGYWDVDRCSWVGVDPVYVVPPLRHAEHPRDRAPGTSEEPAAPPVEDAPGTIELEPGASAPA